MDSHSKPPTSIHTFFLGVLTTLAVPLVITRVLHATCVITITNPAANASTSIATVLAVSAAFSVGWRRSVLHSRAEQAVLIDRISVLEKRVEEAENAAWWGSPNQEAEPERTVESEPNVVAFRHRESRQRGAS